MPGTPTGIPTGNPAIFDQIPQPYLANQNPTWIRYSNGLMEVRGSIASGTLSTGQGGLFTSAAAVAITLPTAVPFTETPQIFTGMVGTNCIGAGVTSPTATGFNLIPYATITASSGTIHWRAVGTWI